VGLRATGNDGRYIRLPGIRDLLGIVTVDAIVSTSGIEQVLDTLGAPVPLDARVETFNWIRPRLSGNQAVLVVEPHDGESGLWIPVDRPKQPKVKA
jgi:hypothetical protein